MRRRRIEGGLFCSQVVCRVPGKGVKEKKMDCLGPEESVIREKES